MFRVSDFSCLRRATPDSLIKIVKDGKELNCFSISADKDGNVIIDCTEW